MLEKHASDVCGNDDSEQNDPNSQSIAAENGLNVPILDSSVNACVSESELTVKAVDKEPVEEDANAALRKLVGNLLIELGNGSGEGIQQFESVITNFMSQNKNKFEEETQF